jgi:arylsulfatase A-like enzyme
MAGASRVRMGWTWPATALALLAAIAFLGIANPSLSGAVSCSRVADSASGSDATGNGTAANPWRTAQKLADNLGPGETGCLRSGTYSENLTVTQGGTSAQRTTLRSYPGETATIAGRVLVTADYVTISQLVLDAHLASGGYGQVVEGDDVTFSDNNVTSGATASCFRIGNQGTSAARALRVMITRNRIHNCKTGVLASAATHLTVSQNLIYDNVDRGVRLEPDAIGGTVFRNVIDGNGEGVLLAGDTATAPTSNTVHRNVISGSSNRWNVGSSFVASNVGAYNHVWSNCLYATNVDAAFNTTGGIVPPSPTRGFAVYDSYLTVGDPQFVNRDAGDFHLKSSSPCLSLTDDIAAQLDGSDTAPPDSAAPIRKPNVLVFLTDDQRTEGTLEAMPKTRKWLQTGGLESGDISAGGTWFPENVGTTPLCCPGRTSIFSGRYSHNTLIEHNCCVEEAFDQDHTLQAYLGRPGTTYRRGMFGRYMNWNYWVNPPHFDRWSIGTSGSYTAPDVNEQGVRLGAARSPRQYVTSYFRDQLLGFLGEQESDDSTPWFAELSTYAPHLPATPDTPYNSTNYPASELPSYTQTPAQLETDLSDKPPWVQVWNDPENTFGPDPDGTRLKELRSLKSVDDSVDEVLTRLEQTGEAADTLVFFTSDNGTMWREHGLTKKSKPYLDSVRVPLFMRWPANPKVRRNSVDSRLTANIDIAATAMDAAGKTADASTPMDGISLLDRSKQRKRILTEYWGDLAGSGDESEGSSLAAQSASATGSPKWKVPPWASIITHDYQYTEYYDDEGTQPTFREFYDLRAGHDPYELENLYGGDGDPSNDPPRSPTPTQLSAQLAKDRLCKGAECPPGPGASSLQDQVPPKVVVISPDDGTTVSKVVQVIPGVWDNLGVSGVRFRLDGTDLVPEQTGQPWGITWDTSTTSNGPHTLTVTARDAAGNTTTVTRNLQVDNAGTDIQAYDGAGTVGFEETDDVVVYNFGTAIDPTSILAGWNGSPTSVTAKFNADDPLHQYNDTFVVLKPDDTTIAPLGTIDLGHSDYVGLYEPGARFTGSTMSMASDARSIAILLGDPNPRVATPRTTPGTMTWEMSPLARTAGGQPFCACRVWEGIPAAEGEDREF